MSKFPSMPLYIDAYLADTTHLTAEEHGAYLLLLMAMWRRNGKVPNDDHDLARICCVSAKRWSRVKARLMPFLTVTGTDELTQKRLNGTWRGLHQRDSDTAISDPSRGGSDRGPDSIENNDMHADSRARDHNHNHKEKNKAPYGASAELQKTAPRQPPLSPQVIGLPTNAGDDYPITTAEVAEWCETYPAVDVGQQLRHMRQWLISNPKNRKTRAGMRKFVTTWLGREQNRAPLFNGTQRATGPPRQDPDREWREIVERKARGE